MTLTVYAGTYLHSQCGILAYPEFDQTSSPTTARDHFVTSIDCLTVSSYRRELRIARDQSGRSARETAAEQEEILRQTEAVIARVEAGAGNASTAEFSATPPVAVAQSVDAAYEDPDAGMCVAPSSEESGVSVEDPEGAVCVDPTQEKGGMSVEPTRENPNGGMCAKRRQRSAAERAAGSRSPLIVLSKQGNSPRRTLWWEAKRRSTDPAEGNMPSTSRLDHMLTSLARIVSGTIVDGDTVG